LHKFKHKYIKLKASDNLKNLDTIRITEGDCPAFPNYLSPRFKLNKVEYLLNIESKVSEYNIFFTSLNSPYTLSSTHFSRQNFVSYYTLLA